MTREQYTEQVHIIARKAHQIIIEDCRGLGATPKDQYLLVSRVINTIFCQHFGMAMSQGHSSVEKQETSGERGRE
jgi:hypothetical protein